MSMTPVDWANFAIVIWPMIERLIVLIEGLVQAAGAGDSKKAVVMEAIKASSGGEMSPDDYRAVGGAIDRKVGEYNAKGWPNA